MMKKIHFILLISFILLMLCATASCSDECRHTNITEKTVAPTCTKNGETVYTCDDCGYSYKANIIEPAGHTYEKKTVSASCTEDGYTEYTCTCGETYISDYVSAKGHDYKNTVIAPTCTEIGYTKHECVECEYSYISNHLNAIGHTLNNAVKAATCTEQGYTEYSCEKCDYSHKADHTKPEDHVFDKTVTAPTCTEMGYTTYKCANCEYSYVSDHISPTGHTYNKETVTQRTCTEKGEDKYICACGDSYSIITAPSGHSFSKITTMPTLSDMGYTEFTCTECQYKYKGDYRFYSEILKDAYAENTKPASKGIDLSYHNYKKDSSNNYIPLDWDAIKAAGVEYVIIRAGYSSQADGSFNVDETFEQSYLAAKAAGLKVGAYFYTCAKSVNDIEIEANLLLDLLKGKKFEYPIYLDLEDESYLNTDKTDLSGVDAQTINEMCMKFFTILQRSGYYTGLYVNSNWLYNLIDTDFAISHFDIWCAKWQEVGNEPIWNTEEDGQPFGMWQYTDSGYIGEMKVDFNYAYKNYPDIIMQGGFNGYENDIRFPDSNKTYVVVTYNGSVRIRSKCDYFITDGYDASLDVITTVKQGTRFEVIEKTENYAAILYNGQTAYISVNPTYVSFLNINAA